MAAFAAPGLRRAGGGAATVAEVAAPAVASSAASFDAAPATLPMVVPSGAVRA